MKSKITLIVLIAILSGCSSGLKSTNTSFNSTLSSSTFDFSPPSDNSNDTDKIIFLFINPKFSTGVSQNWQSRNPFKTFLKNMSVDFVEMLVAKGMPYKGPYENYEEVVYSDKMEADLCLESEVDLQFTGKALRHKNIMRSGVGAARHFDAYWYDGDVSLIGKLNLFVYEPHTHVKLWIKSIPLKTNNFYLKTKYRYDGENIPLDDPGIWNVLVENLEEMYKSTMMTAWRQLDMNELKIKREEARKIAAKAGYNRTK